jgi:hypothetical protein
MNLPVASVVGFSVGDTVTVGMPALETHAIAGIGNGILTFSSPVQYTYTSGTPVAKVPSQPGVVPAAQVRTTLSSLAPLNAKDLQVASVAGFKVGDEVTITNVTGGTETHTVTGIHLNLIRLTLDTQLARGYALGSNVTKVQIQPPPPTTTAAPTVAPLTYLAQDSEASTTLIHVTSTDNWTPGDMVQIEGETHRLVSIIADTKVLKLGTPLQLTYQKDVAVTKASGAKIVPVTAAPVDPYMPSLSAAMPTARPTPADPCAPQDDSSPCAPVAAATTTTPAPATCACTDGYVTRCLPYACGEGFFLRPLAGLIRCQNPKGCLPIDLKTCCSSIPQTTTTTTLGEVPGVVIADRLCVAFLGCSCNNDCDCTGALALSSNPADPPPMPPMPPFCLDHWEEVTIIGAIAAIIVVFFSTYRLFKPADSADGLTIGSIILGPNHSAQKERFCIACGKEFERDDDFCRSCGEKRYHLPPDGTLSNDSYTFCCFWKTPYKLHTKKKSDANWEGSVLMDMSRITGATQGNSTFNRIGDYPTLPKAEGQNWEYEIEEKTWERRYYYNIPAAIVKGTIINGILSFLVVWLVFILWWIFVDKVLQLKGFDSEDPHVLNSIQFLPAEPWTWFTERSPCPLSLLSAFVCVWAIVLGGQIWLWAFDRQVLNDVQAQGAQALVHKDEFDDQFSSFDNLPRRMCPVM